MAMEGAVLGVFRSARPALRSPHDAVAFAVHAAFLAAGFSPIGVGSRADSIQGEEDEVGIEGWNDMEGAYAFRYRAAGPGRSNSVLVKCLVMGEVLLVDAACIRDKSVGEHMEPLHLQIKVLDYSKDTVGGNYGQLFRNLHELVDQINSSILSKLSQQDQNVENSSLKACEEVERGCEAMRYSGTESVIIDDHPCMPRFSSPSVPPIGFSDRMPGPGAGVFPTRIGPEGGMLLGPNDPRWGVDTVPNQGQHLPDYGRLGVPPGARFDPFGPPGVPGFEQNYFIRVPRRPGQTHPDLEHFSPF